MTQFILASGSPRRKQLFALGNWNFEVLVADVDETPLQNESPKEYVVRLAEAKARAIKSKACAEPSRSISDEAIVIGSDTTVVDGEEILGKPSNEKDAERMLKQLRGKIHQVLTAIAVYRIGDEKLVTDLCVIDVPMRNYSDDEISAYIKTGDPMDKAGAYAIQHADFNPVQSLSGCYAGVMGLPMCHVTRVLKKFDVAVNKDIPASCQSLLNYDCKVYDEILSKGNPPILIMRHDNNNGSPLR